MACCHQCRMHFAACPSTSQSFASSHKSSPHFPPWPQFTAQKAPQWVPSSGAQSKSALRAIGPPEIREISEEEGKEILAAFENSDQYEDWEVDLDWRKDFAVEPYPELKVHARKEAVWMEEAMKEQMLELGEEPKMASKLARIAADVLEYIFNRTEVVVMVSVWHGVAADVLREGLKQDPEHIDVGLEAALLVQDRYPDRNDYRSDGPDYDKLKKKDEEEEEEEPSYRRGRFKQS